MHTMNLKVTSKDLAQPLSVPCEVFDTVEEAVEKFGEAGVLEMVNAINQQRVGNKARTDATEGTRRLKDQVLKLMLAGKVDEATALAATIGK